MREDPQRLFVEAGTLAARGDHASAAALYRECLGLLPHHPQILTALGIAEMELSDLTPAIGHLRLSLAINAHQPEAWHNLAYGLQRIGRCEEALVAVCNAVAQKSSLQVSWLLRGNLEWTLGRVEQAHQSYARAAQLCPNDPQVHYNLGNTLLALMRYDEAMESYRRCLALAPNFVDAMINLGAVYDSLGKFAEAEAFYDKALTAVPNYAEAEWNKGVLALARGDFKAGLSLYERRWQTKSFAGHSIQTAQPRWRGEDITGKTILIWAEQGLGDTIQFCRYVPMVCARAARVIFACQPRLMDVMANLKGDFVLTSKEARQPNFDVHCPIMDLPLALGTTLETVPADIPYLSADPTKLKQFDAALGPGPRIGLVWSSHGMNIRGRPRNLPPRLLEPLLDLTGTFHILQKEISPQDEAWLTGIPRLQRHDREQKHFSDAAALVANMDLVLTVDTSVPHLAGALGKPVWVMLPYAADWRWLKDRADSPWYPTVRLFRQPALGDWTSVIREIRTALTGYFRS